MAANFLNQSLAALNRNAYPKLESIAFEGFHVLETANPDEAAAAGLSDTYQAIRDYPFANATFTKIRNRDNRDVFQGFDSKPSTEGFDTALLVSS
jgi:hypothetical protein